MAWMGPRHLGQDHHVDISRPSQVKIRIFNNATTGFYGQQTKGLYMYRRAIARRLQLECSEEVFTSMAGLAKRFEEVPEEAVAVVPHFLTRVDELGQVLEQGRSQGKRVILIDAHDQTSSPHLVLLPCVDRYIKSKMLRDLSDYQCDYLGGYIFSDYYTRTYGFDLKGWQFGSKPDPNLDHRMVPGWNFAVTPTMRYLAFANRLGKKPLRSRRHDLNLRTALAYEDKWEWYQDYRDRCHRATAVLRDRYRTTGQQRIGQFRFLLEMRDSRIVFSPFGWGEICWRDYEAAACGALLIKPSCEHLITSPDIFVDGETYVAVRWDNADLEEKVDYYLRNLDEAQRIADNAQTVLRDYFERGGFLRSVEQAFAF